MHRGSAGRNPASDLGLLQGLGFFFFHFLFFLGGGGGGRVLRVSGFRFRGLGGLGV